jgi:hypothetical protein
MIRYPWTEAEIEQLVDKAVPSWRGRAATRTLSLLGKGKYEEAQKAIWPQVKSVYINKQHHKCIYCERILRGGQKSSVEWALEHFRPKGKVQAWIPKSEDVTTGLDYTDIKLGDELTEGYYPLAYHLWNYAASCHTCNTSFKGDYFPIAKARVTSKNHPNDYHSEGAYLVYPFDSMDADPEDLILFELHKAVPRYSRLVNSTKHIRACVIIDFLGLNSNRLLEDRAEHLYMSVLPALKESDKQKLDRLTSERSAFAGCTRCFIAEYSPKSPVDRFKMKEKLLKFLEEIDYFEQSN